MNNSSNSHLVVIPTYNEIDNIEDFVNQIIKINVDILIVDDNSPDGTGDLVQKLSENLSQVNLLKRSGKLGLGSAYRDGFKWGLNEGYKYLIEMDADFSHDPDDLPRLLYTCSKHGADACVGSRYVPGGRIINWPKSRYWLSYYASLYVRFVLNINIKDTTAGFICYKREVLEKINLDNIWFIGYAFQIEMKYSAIKHGFNVKEIPIHFKDRELGQSKMNIKIFREAFIGVLKLKSKKFEA